jgi:ribosomal protein S20
MMKQISKLLALVVLVTLAVPSFASAQTLPQATNSPSVHESFCDALVTTIEKLDERLKEREIAISSKRDERDQAMNERFQARAESLLVSRTEWDNNRDEEYRLLESRASTSQALTIVKKFELSVNAAVEKRRAVVDTAIHDFQTAVSGEVSARKQAVDVARVALKSEITAAGEKAKEECEAGVKVRTVRSTFITAADSARTQYKKSISNIENRKDTLTPLYKQKETVITKAIEVYRSEIEAAAKELSSVFS